MTFRYFWRRNRSLGSLSRLDVGARADAKRSLSQVAFFSDDPGEREVALRALDEQHRAFVSAVLREFG